MSNAEAQEDGFDNAKDAVNVLREFYPNLKLTDTMAIIRFKVFAIDDIPAIAFNEHI